MGGVIERGKQRTRQLKVEAYALKHTTKQGKEG